MEGAQKAATIGVDVIMLDNMTPEQAKLSFQNIKNINQDILVEISGGITPDNIVERKPEYIKRF